MCISAGFQVISGTVKFEKHRQNSSHFKDRKRSMEQGSDSHSVPQQVRGRALAGGTLGSALALKS